jgi:hypothetical protein
MTDKLKYLEGRPFCMVRMRVLDVATDKVELVPIHGVAKVQPDGLVVEENTGEQHMVPHSALDTIYPSDGTELLKDAEHFVIVKIGPAE